MLDRRGRLLTAALGFALLRSAPNAEIRILRVLSEMKLRVMTLTHRRSGVDRIWARLCDGDRLALT